MLRQPLGLKRSRSNRTVNAKPPITYLPVVIKLVETLQKGTNLLYSGQQESNRVRTGGIENQMRRVVHLSVLLPLLTISLWGAEKENQKPVVTNPMGKMMSMCRPTMR